MPLSLMSVAITVAPSRANAMAHARPMPAAAAVMTARFPLRRSAIFLFSFEFFVVIPGRASWREPGIHRATASVDQWIPGSRLRRAPE
ncbi:hypothetical protein ACVI1J_008298 [Bradyrhizobium diazoefficiens]